MRALLLTIALVCGLMGNEFKTKVVVSVAPQAFFVEKIGGKHVDVKVLVPKSRNPETYEPLPSQMKTIKESDLYIKVGMPFEKRWIPRFINTNPKMKILDSYKQLEGDLKNVSSSHDSHDDPHIWLSIPLVKIQAKQIAQALGSIDIKNASVYREHLKRFLKELDDLDASIKTIFSYPNAKKEFLVYHPAWGHFARDYGLEEIALEVHGKEMKASSVVSASEKIKKYSIHTIFLQPQFSEKRVAQIVRKHKLKIVQLDPLRQDWIENMLYTAKAIASGGNVEGL